MTTLLLTRPDTTATQDVQPDAECDTCGSLLVETTLGTYEHTNPLQCIHCYGEKPGYVCWHDTCDDPDPTICIRAWDRGHEFDQIAAIGGGGLCGPCLEIEWG